MKLGQSDGHLGKIDRAEMNGSTCQCVPSEKRETHRQIGIAYDNAGVMNKKQGSLERVVPSALLY